MAKIEIDLEAVKERIIRGETIGAIASQLYVCNATVANRLNRDGFNVGEAKRNRVCELFNTGKTAKEIAQILNLTDRYICRILNRSGISALKNHPTCKSCGGRLLFSSSRDLCCRCWIETEDGKAHRREIDHRYSRRMKISKNKQGV